MRLLLFLAACGSSQTVTPQPDLAQTAPAYTWTTQASAFFASYCVSCHTPGGQAQQQNFALYDEVKANAVNIRCGVAATMQSGCASIPAPRQFPIGNGPKPTDDERAAIVAWIDNGTPL